MHTNDFHVPQQPFGFGHGAIGGAFVLQNGGLDLVVQGRTHTVRHCIVQPMHHLHRPVLVLYHRSFLPVLVAKRLLCRLLLLCWGRRGFHVIQTGCRIDGVVIGVVIDGWLVDG